jgi:hypothetical protein
LKYRSLAEQQRLVQWHWRITALESFFHVVWLSCLMLISATVADLHSPLAGWLAAVFFFLFTGGRNFNLARKLIEPVWPAYWAEQTLNAAELETTVKVRLGDLEPITEMERCNLMGIILRNPEIQPLRDAVIAENRAFTQFELRNIIEMDNKKWGWERASRWTSHLIKPSR